jgi:hypothetical protein
VNSDCILVAYDARIRMNGYRSRNFIVHTENDVCFSIVRHFVYLRKNLSIDESVSHQFSGHLPTGARNLLEDLQVAFSSTLENHRNFYKVKYELSNYTITQVHHG